MKKILFSGLILSFSQLSFSQDSLNMKLLFHWDEDTIASYQNWGTMAQQYNEIWGYYDSIKEQEYAIIGTAEGTYFWNITNPDSAYLSDYELGRDTAEIHRDFKTYKHYLYGVADEGMSSLQIFDLSYLPDSVHKVYDSQEFVVRSHNCFIADGRLYLCSPEYMIGKISGLRILDIATNPEQPILLKDFELTGPQGNHVHDLFVRDNIAYCSNGFDGLFIFDVSNLVSITTLASITSYSDKGYNHSSWLSEDSKTLFFVDEDHGMRIKAYNVSNFTALEELSLFQSNFGAMPHNVFVRGYKLYVSYYHDGVWVFDVSDPKNPETIAYYDTYQELNGYTSYQGCWGVYPFLPSGNIIASDFSNGLFVLKDNSITKDPPNSISEKKILQPTIYPTLFSTKTSLNIPKTLNIQQFDVYSSEGKLVYSKSDIKSSVYLLDFSFLVKGTYFMYLKGETTNHTIKFVKQ